MSWREAHASLRATLRAIIVCAVAWAGLVIATGGVQFHAGPIRISSREADNPILIALAAALVLIELTRRDGRAALAAEWAWWRRSPRGVAIWTRAHALDLAAAVPAVLALVAIGFQVYRWTGGEPMWIDEEATALIVRERTFSRLAGPVWLATSAPLGWLIAERAVLLLCGAGEVALRFIPMLFGAGTLVTAAWIGRRWLNPVAAFILVLLCAANRFMVLFSFEAKQYSGDAFWGLLLPALALWATEADDDRRIRRAAAWWVAAAVGQWLSSGAAIVTPGCAVVLVAAAWLSPRIPRRTAWTIAALGLVWVAAALLHYQLAMRYTLNSAYFYDYWRTSFPPAAAGAAGTLRWMVDRLPALALVPVGTELWISLWILAVCGFAFASNRALGAVFALVPLAAFALAALHIVPLVNRFVLWMAPPMAVGVALAVDRALRLVYRSRSLRAARDFALIAVAAVVVAAAVRVCANMIDAAGFYSFSMDRPVTKHSLDDRAAVRWLMARREPGDVIATTQLAWPAIWWYGAVPIGSDAAAHGQLPDGSPMVLLTPEEVDPNCTGSPLRSALQGRRRLLLYIGFPDFPQPFPERLMRRLEELGTRTAFAQFGGIGEAAVFDLHPAAPDTRSYCVGVQPAIPW